MQEMTMMTDEALVAAILERDARRAARAFEVLFERYAESLHHHVEPILHDVASAHDVVQETFLRVWNRAAQWNGSGSFRAWLYRIATNLALNHLRTVKRRRELPLVLPPDPDDDEDAADLVPSWMVDNSALGPEMAMELSEQRALYRQAMECLPDDKRDVFRLVYEMELSLRDTADALDIPEGTVKSRLHYARKQLTREWRALESGDDNLPREV